MAGIRLENVVKQYGQVEVVHELSLDIRDGEFLVLVGPSGCGKTTVLRMIAGLEEISDGDLYIGDKRVNDVDARDRDIAMVFQNYALYPTMTVYDNMAFGLKVRKVAKAEIQKRVTQAAEMLELTPYLKRRPKELSGGQRQRVALARAIVRDPQAFLMDEPLSNLDAKLRVQTRAEISRLHTRVRQTFVYVTHDQTEAMTMGDRIAVMNGGVIQQLGTPQTLYDTPSNLFVAGFIGSPAMNLVSEVGITRDGGAVTLHIGDQTLTVSGELANIAKSFAGDTITLGVRPEHVHSVGDGTSQNTLRGTVDVVEHLGNEQVLYTKVGDKTILAREEPTHRYSPGDAITLAVDTSKVHFFDPATSRSLTTAVAVSQ